jgi:hypothetical protein
MTTTSTLPYAPVLAPEDRIGRDEFDEPDLLTYSKSEALYAIEHAGHWIFGNHDGDLDADARDAQRWAKQATGIRNAWLARWRTRGTR